MSVSISASAALLGFFVFCLSGAVCLLRLFCYRCSSWRPSESYVLCILNSCPLLCNLCLFVPFIFLFLLPPVFILWSLQSFANLALIPCQFQHNTHIPTPLKVDGIAFFKTYHWCLMKTVYWILVVFLVQRSSWEKVTKHFKSEDDLHFLIPGFNRRAPPWSKLTKKNRFFKFSTTVNIFQLKSSFIISL